ncbi:MAG: hypothetical protein SVY41_01820 [Candidatus Nanohaloarchaea archaeon]|nr:hypothetical protein [Candidatus Nanohaloarchaea archaeon]
MNNVDTEIVDRQSPGPDPREQPGYITWGIEDDAYLEFQVVQYGASPVLDFAWGTDADRESFDRTAVDDDWLGDTAEVLMYSEAGDPGTSPAEIPLSDYREGQWIAQELHAVELVRTETPEQYVVGWDRYGVDAACPHRVTVTVDPSLPEQRDRLRANGGEPAEEVRHKVETLTRETMEHGDGASLVQAAIQKYREWKEDGHDI